MKSAAGFFGYGFLLHSQPRSTQAQAGEISAYPYRHINDKLPIPEVCKLRGQGPSGLFGYGLKAVRRGPGEASGDGQRRRDHFRFLFMRDHLVLRAR